MYNVLIVGNDPFLLDLLAEEFKNFGDFYTPIHASNGDEAVEILRDHEIYLLVTDLFFPGKLDGLALLDHLKEHYPDVPAMVIADHEDQEKIKQLKGKVRHIFYKPIKAGQLAKAIITFLNKDINSKDLKGRSVSSFLQLLENEGKTCLLEISKSPKDKGLLYIHKGTLYNAVYGDYHGREAACRLIGMDNALFQIKALPKKQIPQRIDSRLIDIIRETISQKGESTNEPRHIVNSEMPNELANPIRKEENVEEGQQNDQAGESISPSKQKEADVMALETIMENLRSINGYKAGALMNFTGEILVADTIDLDTDLANVGAVFNDIFRAAHEAAGKVGLKVCNELTLKTPNGVIVMACSGVDAASHFHLIVVLDADGNQALVKMQFNKMIPMIMDELG